MTRNRWKGVVGAAALVATGVAGAARADGIVVKMATLVPQGSVWHTTLLEMGQQWQKASGGRVTVRLYPGGVAGDDGDVVRKMRLGTLDASLLTAAGFGDIDRALYALEVPMAYASYGELDYVLDKMTPMLAQIYAAKGFVVLAWADAGWVHFFAKAPVRTPDDLKRQKLFNWAGDPQSVEMWRAAGFDPVPLPSTEISTALQTGLVTALPTTVQAALLLQWYSHAPYMTDVNWAVLLGAVVITKAAWERIPAEVRPALRAAAEEAGRKLREQTRAQAGPDLDAITKRGLKVVPVDAATAELWRKTAEATYPKVRGGYVPVEAFDAALRFRDEYRKSAADKASR